MGASAWANRLASRFWVEFQESSCRIKISLWNSDSAEDIFQLFLGPFQKRQGGGPCGCGQYWARSKVCREGRHVFEVARDVRFHAPNRRFGMSLSARARVVGEALQSDRDVVTAAVQQNALALHFASPRLKRDKASVILAEGLESCFEGLRPVA